MEKSALSTLTKRILSAIILIPPVLVAIVFGGWIFGLLVLVAFVITFWEWKNLAALAGTPAKDTLTGLFYLLACFSAFALLRYSFPEGMFLAVSLILCVWASDTGAYIAGKTIGGPKLAPTVSPKKTWAGLVGGMICSGLVLMTLTDLGPIYGPRLEEDLNLPFPNRLYSFGAGALLAFVGQIGDLFKSKLKRRAGVKDSGNLIPGHGGLLDRIDALLLASPAYLMMIWVLQP